MITGIMYGLVCMAGWGLADFLAARASKSYGSLTTFMWMQIGGLALLLPLAPWLDEGAQWTGAQQRYALVGVFLFAAVYLLLYRSFEKGIIAVISPIFSAYVIIAVVVGLTIFGERLSSLQSIAVALVIAGTLLASSDWRQAKSLKAEALTKGIPEAFAGMLLAGIFFSILALLARQVGWFGPILRIRVGALLLTAILVFAQRQKLELNPTVIRWLIPAGIIDSIAFLAFNLGLRVAPAALIAPIAGSFSVITIALALIFFRERPAANQWAGVIAIIGGIVVISIT